MIFTLYGNGLQEIDITAAREAAHAVGPLLHHDAALCEEFTFISG